MAVPSHGKLGIARVLALSWAVFAQRWLSFCGMLLISGTLSAVAMGIAFLAGILFVERMPSPGGGDVFNFSDSQTLAIGVTLVVMAAIGFAIQQIGAAAVTFGTVRHLSGQEPGFGRCLGHGFSVMLPVMATAGTAALIFGLATLALVANVSEALFLATLVLAPLAACYFFVAVPAAAMERTGAGRALTRSIRLTRSNYFRVLGLLLIVAALGFAVLALLGSASDVIWDFAALFSLAAILAVSTFAAVVAAVAYVELRRVTEGFGAEEIVQRFD